MVNQRTSLALVLAGLGMFATGPEISFVPPSDHGSKVEILRPHKKIDVRKGPVHVQIGAVPTSFAQVGDALDDQAEGLRFLGLQSEGA